MSTSPDSFNPIIRAFCRIRAALCPSVCIPRRLVIPNASLESLIPLARRRAAWSAFRGAGLQLPALRLSPFASIVLILSVVSALIGLWSWTGQWWWPAVAFVPAWFLAYQVSRPWAIHLPPFLRTVGELAVYGTRLGNQVMHQWSHGDISLKVRLVLAESLGLPLEEIRPESTFRELGAW